MLTDWFINPVPPLRHQSQPHSQDLSFDFWAGNEVKPIRDADKKFPTLSVGGLILTELHFKSNFNRRIKQNETIKSELSLTLMGDQICKTRDKTKR